MNDKTNNPPEQPKEAETKPKDASPDLASTLGAYSTRIQQKIKEQEVRVGQLEEASQKRHELMLLALMKTRKTLIDVTRIDLGKDFSFELQADDAQGWPRLQISVYSSHAGGEDESLPVLLVTAHDRNAQGAIEMEILPVGHKEALYLSKDNEISLLSSSLKRIVRAYLDNITEALFAKTAPTKQEDEDKKILEEKVLEQMSSRFGSGDIDLFSEDSGTDDFLETLPSMDNIEELPSEKPKGSK